MTTAESIKILTAISLLFPKFKLRKNKEELRTQADLWRQLIGDLDFKIAIMAVKKHGFESVFPPTAADIRRQASEIISPKERRLQGVEAWGELKNAIRKFGYYQPDRAIATLSTLTQKVVELIGFEELCLSENQIADRAHFLKAFDTIKKREEQDKCLPLAFKNEIAQIAGRAKKLQLKKTRKGDHNAVAIAKFRE